MLIDVEIDDVLDGPEYMNEQERVEAQAGMKIGIFRALQLGDLLCCVPAMRALRNCYPKAEITLFGLPWAQQFVKRFSKYFDHFKHFPGYPGLPEQLFDAGDTSKFIEWAQAEKFDLIFQMQGNGTLVNPLIMMMDAKFSAGFFTPGHYYPNNGLFLEYPNDVHEIERHLMLMKHIGIESSGSELEFPLNENDWDELRKLQLPLFYQDYVCIHPGSRGGWRQWPTSYFALLGDYCISQKLKVVLTGTADEMQIVNEVKKQMTNEPIIVAGRTSLGAMGALIKNAYALISNCTGVSHIAAALQTPSVVISMDGEPHRWAPLNSNLHKTINWLATPDFDLVFKQVEVLLNRQVTDNSGASVH